MRCLRTSWVKPSPLSRTCQGVMISRSWAGLPSEPSISKVASSSLGSRGLVVSSSRSKLRDWDQCYQYYLNPKSMLNISPKPIIIALKAIILHTFWGSRYSLKLRSARMRKDRILGSVCFPAAQRIGSTWWRSGQLWHLGPKALLFIAFGP